MSMKLKMKEAEILRLLQADARITLSDLSKKIDRCLPTTSRYINKLRSSGMIERYTIIMNRKKIGLNLLVYCYVSLKRVAIPRNEIEQTLVNMPEIIGIASLAGKNDYLLKIVTEDVSGYHNFLKTSIFSLGYFESIESNIVFTEVKFNRGLPI